jgi:hypothetical protein
MKLTLLNLLFLLFSLQTIGQVTDPSYAFEKAEIGTYQIRLSSTKFEYGYTEETLIYFEKNRKEYEDVILQLNGFTTVYIPSKMKISSSSFKPLAEIIYQ